MTKVLEIAYHEFEKKLNVNRENYIATIDEADEHFIVFFRGKNASSELRGSPEGVPGFYIKIQKGDYKVLESQFIR